MVWGLVLALPLLPAVVLRGSRSALALAGLAFVAGLVVGRLFSAVARSGVTEPGGREDDGRAVPAGAGPPAPEVAPGAGAGAAEPATETTAAPATSDVKVVPITYATVVDHLLTAVPGFEDVYERHLSLYDEVLPHVLFGEFTRFLVEAHTSGRSETVDRGLRFLESALRDGDALVKSLVSASFVENCLDSPDGFVDSWPQGLRDELGRQRRARGLDRA